MIRKILNIIPNLLTLLNALCGISVIFLNCFIKNNNIILISVFIVFLGAIIDGVDGRVARKLGCTSKIGKELDSFADIITFGIAPMNIFLNMYYINLNTYIPITLIIISIIYILSGIFRLARYNTEDYSKHFEGLPITIAGVLICIFIIGSKYLIHLLMYNHIYNIFSFIYILTLSILMVSSFTIKRI